MEAGEELSNVQTEPILRSPNPLNDDDIQSDSKPGEFMTKAGNGSIPTGRTSDPDTENTVVERQSTQVSRNDEKKGVFNRFHKKKHGSAEEAEAEDAEKKRPWYKGKVLAHKPFTLRNQIGATIFNSWINILLLAAPVGIAVNYAGLDGKIIFVVNFIAIIPLAAMLSFATEEIALHVGESLGGLLNASFG